MTDGTVIHRPDPRRAEASRMASFQRLCEERTGRRFASWPEFHRWSVECFRDFWRLFLEWADPAVEGDRHPVCQGDDIETAAFFPGLRLNHAWNLLRPLPGQEEATALVARDETGRPVAYNASYFFYWLDRKGWNIPREAISPDEVRAYARKGARFFVSEKDVLDAAPGLEARLRAAFPAAAECPAAILFRIEDSGPAPDRISK